MDADVMDANLLLMVTPPRNQLASVKTANDIAMFRLCLIVMWIFSKLRGRGIIFFRSLRQLGVLLLLGFLPIRRLYRRSFT